MFKNYLTAAVRSLLKNKLYSFINIGGLAIGLAACILILLFVRDEVSYDTWIPNVERIYKLEVTFFVPGREPIASGQTPGPAGEALATYFDELEETTRIYRTGGTFTYGENQFNERVYFVDANFFSVFDLPMVAGDRKLAMTSNTGLLINEELATKYFGDADPLGQTVTFNNETDYEVVGVFKDIPENTHFDTGIIALFDELRYTDRRWVSQEWTSSNMSIYALLREGMSIDAVSDRLPQWVADKAILRLPPGMDIEASDLLHFDFLAVKDIHLYAEKPDQLKPAGDIMAVYTFSAVAILILVIASINFMNLATARAMKRAREVSIRKVLGASRKQLISQFLGEAVMTTLFALIFAVGAVELILPFYNEYLNKELSLGLLVDPIQSLGFLALAVSVGIFGGTYPAIFLSSFRPARILRANKSSATGSPMLRHILVVIQFSISIALIISTAVVYGQTIYAQTLDAGYSREQKITLHGLFVDGGNENIEALKAEFMTLPGVISTAMASDSIPQNSESNTGVEIPGVNDGQPLIVEEINVGPTWFQTYDIAPIAGRVFSEDYRADFRNVPEDEEEQATGNIIVNETFLRKAGYASPEDAIGQVVKSWVDQDGRKMDSIIVGVIGDLHLRSVHFPITPMVWYLKEDKNLWVMTLQLDTTDLATTLASIDRVWTNMFPEIPVSRSFVQDNIEALYVAEEQRGQMFAAFAIFAVLVASLGLYGLASFAAEQRTKEIGIRKVMGASMGEIVQMLVWQFSKPVIWANLIAWPVAWYLMRDWLNQFEYRIELNILLFVGAGAIALFVAWLTVAHRAFRVARANPIKALRYE
jgi:putative ABC transport system permease protein